jgi:hypothetical protein
MKNIMGTSGTSWVKQKNDCVTMGIYMYIE